MMNLMIAKHGQAGVGLASGAGFSGFRPPGPGLSFRSCRRRPRIGGSPLGNTPEGIPMSRVSFVLRSLFLLGFILAMPLLALPSVSRWLDEALYGNAESKPAADDWNKTLESSPADEKVAQATFDTPVEKTAIERGNRQPARGLDSIAGGPPDLAA